MNGAPKDLKGCCNAWLCIADDYGDNPATARCNLPPGHEGPHRELCKDRVAGGTITIEWDHDHSILCHVHGRQQKIFPVPEDLSWLEQMPECETCYFAKYRVLEEVFERAKSIVLQQDELQHGAMAYSIAWARRVVGPIKLVNGDYIQIPEEFLNSMAFFLDLYPGNEWPHISRFIFVNENNEIIKIDSQWPSIVVLEDMEISS